MTDPLSILRVYLTPDSETALHEAAERTGDTQTDILNRALQVYGKLTWAADRGAQVFVRWPKQGDVGVDLVAPQPDTDSEATP